MKSDFAIFTIVQNEKYFLPKLIKYYTQYIDPLDFYVLDHDSNDGSTDDLDVNVVKVSYEKSFDHEWLVGTVVDFQEKLLKKYKHVIFIEADDFLYTLKGDFLSQMANNLKHHDYVVNTGYNIVHDFLNTEKDSNLTYDEFMCSSKHRKYWSRKPNHDKGLIAKRKLKYSHGFHNVISTDAIGVRDSDLFLAHLHTVDWDINLKRNSHRLKNRVLKKEDLGGSHNKSIDFDLQKNHFMLFLKNKTLIPEEHKNRMIELGI